MLKLSQEAGTVVSLTNLYDAHFKPGSTDKGCHVPYLEGDYFIGEAENILDKLAKEEKKAAAGDSKAAKPKTKKRARPLPEEEAEDPDRDQLMVRMGKTLLPMKEAFIVAHLREPEFAKQCEERLAKETVIRKAHEEAQGKNPAPPLPDAPDDGPVEKTGSGAASAASAAAEPDAAEDQAAAAAASATPPGAGEAAGEGEKKDAEMKDASADGDAEQQKGAAPAATASSAAAASAPAPASSAAAAAGPPKGKGSKGAKGKAPSKGEGADAKAAADSAKADAKDRKEAQEAQIPGIEEDETEDPDPNIESEFFDTRQQFLNLCQGNHYQFDKLRRAKHTSMMVSGWREKRNDPRGRL